MSDESCQIDNCTNKAKFIGQMPKQGIVKMCPDCYHTHYKNKQ